MRYLISIFIIIISLHVFAQSDSVQYKYNRRFWINPFQMITGKYTLAYAWRTHEPQKWLEAGVGYRYLPYSLVDGLLIAPSRSPYSNPKFGAGYTGPSVSFSFTQYYAAVKSRMKKATETNPELAEMIRHQKPLNSMRLEITYEYLTHRADCYYAGEEEDSYTYSAWKNVFTGKILFSKINSSDDHHTLTEWYAGAGFHVGLGQLTKYDDPDMHHYGSSYLCVQDIHSPEIIKTNEFLWYLYPAIQFGLRVGFQ